MLHLHVWFNERIIIEGYLDFNIYYVFGWPILSAESTTTNILIFT